MKRNEIDYDLLFDVLTVDNNVKKENEAHGIVIKKDEHKDNKTGADLDMFHVSHFTVVSLI